MQNQDKPFGVPHHTDTSVILSNKDLLCSAGIDAVPTSLDEAWTWDSPPTTAARWPSRC